MPEPTKPNIVLIISDQHHKRFMGCAGEPLVQTPNLDSLAARGVRFENAYCSFPICCPSRMSFLSSQLPSAIDVLDNAAQLSSDVPTFAHAFNEAGYETVLCGRMHFNGPDQRHGFKRRIIGDVIPAFNVDGQGVTPTLGETLRNTTGPGAHAIRVSGRGDSGYLHYDQAVTETAADYIHNHTGDSDQPFMMVVGGVLPHAPFVAKADDFDYYDSKITVDDLPDVDIDALHPENRRTRREDKLEDAEPVSLEDQRRARVAYYGMVTYMDRMIGNVVNAIDEAGIADNTIIVYISDHGEQLGEHGLWWKRTFYEGSVGVPMIFVPPKAANATFKAGHVVKSNVSLIDVGPTLLDLVDGPPIPTATGQSFRCLLEGDEAAWHDTVIAECLRNGKWGRIHRMVKRGPWKLCHYPAPGPAPSFEPELFNLEEDPAENTNRASDPACAQIVKELTAIATNDWDHDALVEQYQTQQLTRPWIHQGLRTTDLPEPDGPWYAGRDVHNHLDPNP